jgi:hypothetical protein
VTFVAWLVAAGLVIWLFILIRSSALGILDIYYVGESARRAWQVKLFDKIYALIAASLGIGLIAAGEPYFGKLVRKPNVLKAIARVLGPELLVISFFHGVLLVLQGFTTGLWLRWVAFGVELLAGIALAAYGFARQPSEKNG